MKELDFTGLNDYLMRFSIDLLHEWLVEGELKGREFICGDLSGRAGRSCSINVDTGRWADFDSDERGGDLISLYAAINRMSQGEAAKELARKYQYNLERNSAPRVAKPVSVQAPPPGADLPSMRTSTLGDPVGTWVYRDLEGYPMFCVARYTGKDGKKTYLPWCWSDGMWVGRSWPAPRPLYGLELLHQYPDRPVLVVEGEKAADAARKIVGDRYVVLCWSHGSNAVLKSDFTPLYGKKILLWPDNDEPGIAAMNQVAHILYKHCPEVKIIDVSM